MAEPQSFPTPTAHPQPSGSPVKQTAVQPTPQPRDSIREVCETIAFVVTLVLMLKLFVVEAFVIPTGSMAETLYGYQKIVDCDECGFNFPVNSSNEVEPTDGPPTRIIGACCPNCRHRQRWPIDKAPVNRSGDRVLVHKVMYHFTPPEPGDVVVFKFPVDPQVKHTAQNYIKRLWGRGSETLAINRGDLYRTRILTYPVTDLDSAGRPKFPRPSDPNHLWEGPEAEFHSKTSPRFRADGIDYTYHNAEEAVQLFDASRLKGFTDPSSGFELIRKSDDLVMAMRRIVYDNEHQPKSFAARSVPPRWGTDPTGWTADKPNEPKAFTHTGTELNWVRYRHMAPRSRDDWEVFLGGLNQGGLSVGPVTNFLGYNAGLEEGRGEMRNTSSDFWVGDLILECEAVFQTADATAVLELSKGPHRYQAIFENGQVKLIRTGPQGKELATAATGITGPGMHAIRFANVDCRLRVWVDEKRIDFGDSADYPPDTLPEKFEDGDRMEEGWTALNDIAAPASVGAKGGVEFRKLKLWRDSYFTYADQRESNIARFVDTFYVQPDHFLCLGDNSAQSSDSRKWGTVPERLMLGKAVFVFFPVNRIGLIE